MEYKKIKLPPTYIDRYNNTLARSIIYFSEKIYKFCLENIYTQRLRA